MTEFSQPQKAVMPVPHKHHSGCAADCGVEFDQAVVEFSSENQMITAIAMQLDAADSRFKGKHPNNRAGRRRKAKAFRKLRAEVKAKWRAGLIRTRKVEDMAPEDGRIQVQIGVDADQVAEALAD